MTNITILESRIKKLEMDLVWERRMTESMGSSRRLLSIHRIQLMDEVEELKKRLQVNEFVHEG